MRDMRELVTRFGEYEFTGYTERQKDVANNFMVARPGSAFMEEYYNRICAILRSGRVLSWTTLGLAALTATILELRPQWLRLARELIQPICWSEPNQFFAIRPEQEHEAVFNRRSLCYMLSNVMVQEFAKTHTGMSLLSDGTFFRFLHNHATSVRI